MHGCHEMQALFREWGAWRTIGVGVYNRFSFACLVKIKLLQLGKGASKCLNLCLNVLSTLSNLLTPRALELHGCHRKCGLIRTRPLLSPASESCLCAVLASLWGRFFPFEEVFFFFSAAFTFPTERHHGSLFVTA